MRVGFGVDVHAFEPGLPRPLKVGGVVVPDGPPLAGHSDADPLLHAVTDAVLGAAALGDLGTFVGTDRPETAGADSSTFLARAVEAARAAGWTPANLDATVVCQRPRIGPHREGMRVALAGLLDVALDAVSVKATTTDHLGFLGRGEGIAVVAAVLLAPVRLTRDETPS